MKTYLFRAVAFDETRYWNGLPPACTRVFGTYLFCEGEATHCCELMPSSRCEPLNNVFCGLRTDDAFVEEHLFDGNEDCIYVRMLDPAKRRDWVSEPIEIEAESRDEAWEAATEYAHGNEPQIPAVSTAWLSAAPN
ncbi:MAG: hypothetical protein EPN36_03290 [Rhodanobacteraceae bacterium]|nr:MAG: hypothetical protein EPN36_03290 [Rhodanobacteraceae bacterium]